MLKLKKFKMCKLKFGSTSLFLSVLVLLTSRHQTKANEGTHYMPALECYDPYGRPQRCLPEFVNAGYQLPIEATNTCGRYGDQEFCVQTGYSNQKSCDICTYDTHPPEYLTDLHDPQNPTWWQSETMFEGVQQRNQVNLTLHLGKSFDITYIRIVFYSPRPESFAIYKRVTENGQWIPYQYYSSTCRDTYNLPDSLSVEKGQDESRALCTSEYSDISPLRDGNIAFSSLEGRPSATNFENSPALQSWVTATDIRIVLDRLNTFGDEVFGDPQVLKSYFFAIADIAVGARCKCNGHASKCVTSTGLNGERTLVCECKHNTDGPDCEKCLPLYNDVEWRRATSKNVNECKPCNCNGYSEKCFFDSHLFNLTGHGGHCVDCKENRDGSNCERCKENFYMRDDGYCIHCGCHPTGSRSLQCNTEGRCQCKPGVTGEKCDRCEANFYQFGPHGCQPCGCDVRGSFDNTPSCDSETGVCRCKEHVEGRRCKECKPGFFNIDLDNRFGCTPCFCYGHTSECQSAGGYSVFSITSNFNKHQERWTAIDNYNRKVDIKHNPYSQSIGTIAQGNDFIYFSASDRFLGDQRASYNRFLKFRLQLVDQIGPSPSSSDVILEGAGARISLPIFAQGNNLPDEQSRLYAFRLHEHPDYSWQPSQSARGFMSILSNLTAVKIRASYALQGEAILDNVELQTAHRGAAGQPATWIEQCTCPDGYLGQFCESCAPGYRHIPARGGPFMKCVLCDCNKHAEICDSETGRCICQHNTAGDTCDQCARGYFGNALGGTQHDCKRCPCPDNGACLQMPDDSVICTECPTGYFGQKCEQCSDGFYGDPHGIHGNVRKCQACECNGNVDLNAVGNCNRTTGECLKCIYNTAGPHCDQCLPGYFGDPLALPHGQCDRCSCYLQGTEQTEDGISQCDQLSGNCKCKPNVFGRNCDNCEPGYFNIVSGNGCESCFCDPVGSYNSSCDLSTGQCYCKPGVTGLRCNECEKYYYGFSTEGCKSCDCDESGSKGYQCDKTGQCPCNDNVEGKRCDRCKENKYNRHEGCLNCPFCYNLVQDAADDHRAKLKNLTDTLENISVTPVTNDEEFDAKLKVVSEKIDILLDDAKAGAGGGDQTLVERLHDLQKKLDKIQKLLNDSAKHKNTADRKYEQAQKNFTEANKIIENIKAELNEAVDLLKAEGSQALQRAEKKKTGYGNHSDPISAISRDARNRALQLQSEAKFKLDKSKEANDAALKAYDLARSALTLQKNISNELRSDVRFEMAAAKETLEKTKQLTQNAVKMANETYDTALTLFTTVDGITVPEIDIAKLKADSADAYEQAEALEEKVRRITEDNESAAFAFDEEVELSDLLLKRAHIQKEEDIALLKDAQAAYEEALKAVQLGDSTLKDANATYNKIAGFQAEFKNLSAIAELSLQNVPAIRQDITDANQLIQEADDALRGAKENVNETLKNARDAQEKYAEQASRDAEKIRIKANETKVDARKLRSEADQLNNRVAVTEQSISNLEADSTRDDKLINEVKRKVAQAKADSFEAQSLAKKALDEISEIMEELKNFRDINSSDLNLLERRLEAAEQELYRTNITERLKQVRDLRNKQQMWAEQYEKEASLLKDEVSNIKNIRDSLPSGCFNQRSKLEP